jgi:hypothetical protein
VDVAKAGMSVPTLDGGMFADGGAVDAGDSVDSTEERIYIVPATEARKFGAPASASYWTPSSEDALALAAELPKYLREHQDLHMQAIFDSLPTYHAQLAGVVRGGKRMIAANYFCPRGFAERFAFTKSADVPLWLYDTNGVPKLLRSGTRSFAARPPFRELLAVDEARRERQGATVKQPRAGRIRQALERSDPAPRCSLPSNPPPQTRVCPQLWRPELQGRIYRSYLLHPPIQRTCSHS